MFKSRLEYTANVDALGLGILNTSMLIYQKTKFYQAEHLTFQQNKRNLKMKTNFIQQVRMVLLNYIRTGSLIIEGHIICFVKVLVFNHESPRRGNTVTKNSG